MYILEKIFLSSSQGPRGGDDYEAVNTTSTAGEMDAEARHLQYLRTLQRRNAEYRVPALTKGKSLLQKLSVKLLGNPDWNFFQGIPESLPFRTKLRIKLNSSKGGLIWDLFQISLCMISCGLYVSRTYGAEGPQELDLAINIMFSIDFVLRLYCSEKRRHFIISPFAVIDYVTILPVFYRAITQSRSEGVLLGLQFLRFTRILKMMKIFSAMQHTATAAQRQLLILMITIASLIFLSAGLIQLVEGHYIVNEHGEQEFQATLTYGDAIYYVIVTTSTVGYGDISPKTALGKLVVSGMIITSLVVVPTQLATLAEILKMSSPFRVKYKPKSDGREHLLIVGHVTNTEILRDFLFELYHPDRDAGADDGEGAEGHTPVVIMGPHEPPEVLRNLLVTPFLIGKVQYIKGSVMSEDDLRRVRADRAKACFILTDKSTRNPQEEDAKTTLRALMIENFNPQMTTLVEVIRAGNRPYLEQADADHIVCVDELKLTVFAASCICPGISTLFTNLIKTNSAPKDNLTQPEMEYLLGSALEVYVVQSPSVFYGMSFLAAAEAIYECFEGRVFLVGVEEALTEKDLESIAKSAQDSRGRLRESFSRLLDERDTRPAPLYLNPGGEYKLRPGLNLFVICDSSTVADKVRRDESYQKYLARKKLYPSEPMARQDFLSRSRSASSGASSSSVSRVVEPSQLILEAGDTRLSHFQDHIIVICSLHAYLKDFIVPLRKRLSRQSVHHRSIVFLGVNGDVAAATELAAEYSDVFVMKVENGDLFQHLELAGFNRARFCLILGDITESAEVEGEQLDHQTIIRFLIIQKLLDKYEGTMSPEFKLFVEFSSQSTVSVMDRTTRKRLVSLFGDSREENVKTESSLVRNLQMLKQHQGLREFHQEIDKELKQTQSLKAGVSQRDARKKKKESSVHLPFLAAGYAFSPDLVDSLLCQTYFCPDLFRFAKQFLMLEDEDSRDSSGVPNSSVFQIPVPEEFWRKDFQVLFRHFLQRHQAIALALYRRPPSNVQLPYVFTGPFMNTVVEEGDKVFILIPPTHPLAIAGRVVESSRDLKLSGTKLAPLALSSAAQSSLSASSASPLLENMPPNPPASSQSTAEGQVLPTPPPADALRGPSPTLTPPLPPPMPNSS